MGQYGSEKGTALRYSASVWDRSHCRIAIYGRWIVSWALSRPWRLRRSRVPPAECIFPAQISLELDLHLTAPILSSLCYP